MGGGELSLAILDLALLLVFILLASSKKRWPLFLIFLLVYVIYGFILTLHPNIPDFITGIDGFRKTYLFVSAIIIGTLVGRNHIASLSVYILLSILIVGVYGLKQVIHWGDFDDAIRLAQSADLYTGLFGGVPRPFGLYSSPFHLGMAGVLGVILTRYLKSVGVLNNFTLIALTALFSAVVIASGTRSSIIVLCFVLFVSFGRAILFYLLFAFVLFVLISMSASSTESSGLYQRVIVPISSLMFLQSDSRLLNRGKSYEDFYQAYIDRPEYILTGFGTGSAGDTLGDRFMPNGYHITSHNLLLKIIFEAGVIGVLFIITLVARFFISYSRWHPHERVMGVSLVGAVFISGLVGSAIEIWPVSIYYGICIGMLFAAIPESMRS
jgi:hypothetical protein